MNDKLISYMELLLQEFAGVSKNNKVYSTRLNGLISAYKNSRPVTEDLIKLAEEISDNTLNFLSKISNVLNQLKGVK